jgi:hypothetical protein
VAANAATTVAAATATRRARDRPVRG